MCMRKTKLFILQVEINLKIASRAGDVLLMFIMESYAEHQLESIRNSSYTRLTVLLHFYDCRYEDLCYHDFNFPLVYKI
jgi:hypothetical protein